MSTTTNVAKKAPVAKEGEPKKRGPQPKKDVALEVVAPEVPKEGEPKKRGPQPKKDVKVVAPEVEKKVVALENKIAKTKENMIDEVNVNFEEVIKKLSDELVQLKLSKNSSSVTSVKSVTAQLKQLQKDVGKVLKQKKKRTSAPNLNSGFHKKVTISEEFAKFFGVSHETQFSRIECQKMLHDYIKTHDLKNKTPKKGQEIIPDKPLATLLRWTEDKGVLKFPTVNKILEEHIIKEKK